MIDFIICDDDEKVLKNVEKIISKYMMKNKLAYKIYLFNDYDEKFDKIIEKPLLNKIYILDIETPSRSGIDIARCIRNKDLKSVIIFLTSHDELGLTILKKELLFLSFINKMDDYENRLNNSISSALKILNSRNVVRFEDKGGIYTILVDDIVYVIWDNCERKSIIKTINSSIKTGKSLIELQKILGESFIRTHKACLVNKNHILGIEKHDRIIKLDTGEKLDLLSIKYKKELINSLK